MKVDPGLFRRTMGGYPTGVTVVTALGTEGPSGMTASAVSSLSLEPPLLLVCFDRTARTLRAVRRSGRFAVNVLAAGQEELGDRFAAKLAEARKWDGVGWTERQGSPALEGALAWIGCELGELLDGGDHVIAIGAVLELAGGEGEPLVHHRGRYRRLAPGGEPAELDGV